MKVWTQNNSVEEAMSKEIESLSLTELMGAIAYPRSGSLLVHKKLSLLLK